jgi:phospholipase D1/2
MHHDSKRWAQVDVTTSNFSHSGQTREDIVPSEDTRQIDPIIKPGRNAWQSARARKVAFLVDGAEYYTRLDQMLRRAERSIFIIGWDFNPNIKLRPDLADSPTLGDIIRAQVDANPELEVRILIWGSGPIYSGKSLKFFGKMEWSDHPRISLRFDFRHPLRGSHHQKIAVIDDEIGFVGGMDLTARRWDDRDHKIDNPLRISPDGTAYGPVHDMQTLVSGDAARMLGDVARRRWRKTIGEDLAPLEQRGDDRWPEDLEPALTDCQTAVALTEPWRWNGKRGHREAIRLTHEALKAATTHLYIETQYLASFGVARTLARRLKKADCPEIVIIVTHESHGFLEKIMMGQNRNRLIRRLMRVDRNKKLRIYYAVTPDGNGGEREIIVHSKVIIVDDRFVRVGSSNLNNRSEGLDTECDLAMETALPEGRLAVTTLRNDLIAEHLGVSPIEVTRVIAETGSMLQAIDRLNTGSRGLRSFNVDAAKGDTDSVVGTGIIDPKQPYWPIPEIKSGFRRLLARLPYRVP